ncbi:hypothetical protein [Symmachiella dynata]|uniref:hypothetical protein n=1 Tax=Symmachiella dynata TaxID=2527995 RepID=UPI0030ED7C7F|tara:strand:+ start:618 stop:902 length:285 start_codon:yes stop_codon:yes gene_type:complete
MNISPKAKSNSNKGSPKTFTVQLCSKDGRLLNEYSLTCTEHSVTNLAAAEQNVLETLCDYQGEPLVIVVSEDTGDGLQQVHLKLLAANDGVVNL